MFGTNPAGNAPGRRRGEWAGVAGCREGRWGRGVGDVVVVPGHQRARGVDAAPQVVEAAAAVEVVLQVILAAPDELHRRGDLARDPGGFNRVVRESPAAETAAGADHVHV